MTNHPRKHPPIVACLVCGAPVNHHRGMAPRHCELHAKAHRLQLDKIRKAKAKMNRALPKVEFATPATVIPPGFCKLCGVIRLSCVDHGGMCYECRVDAAKHHSQQKGF
jgi:hypothetical protein